MNRHPLRPIWRHDNALFRRTAIELSRDPRLIPQLPRLAIGDPSPDVRRAALERCQDLVAAQHMAHNDADDANRTHARRLYVALMAGTHDNAPRIADRLRLLRVQEDPALMLHLCAHSPDQGLREAALQKLEAQLFVRGFGASAEVDRIDESPIFNRARSRALLRRAIVTAAYQVEAALKANDHAALAPWIDAMERFLVDWPARSALPHGVVRTGRLLLAMRTHSLFATSPAIGTRLPSPSPFARLPSFAPDAHAA